MDMGQGEVSTWARKLVMEDLVWMGSDAKSMFRMNRFWPTFVGAKIQGDKETARGSLPVLLWPEQRQYLDTVGGIGVKGTAPRLDGPSSADSAANDGSNKSTRRKRKREEENVGAVDAADAAIEAASSGANNTSPYTNAETLVAGLKPIVRGYTNPAHKRRRGLALGFSSIAGALGGIMSFSGKTVRSLVSTVGLGGLLPKQPLLSHEEQRCAVFKDLQDKGFFIGPADVYGGDYNIYQGDPSNSHSMATIRVVYNGKVSGRDMLGFSRVQNQVAKSAVFAFVTPDAKDPICYTVINFQSVSDRI